MLRRTSEYALRALIDLAQHTEEWPIPGSTIAERAGIPPKYLSAVLSNLVRQGVLESIRGKSGGFSMAHAPEHTSLLDVLTPFEQFGTERCPFGNDRCNEEDPCAAHHEWTKVRAAQHQFLHDTSVYDIAVKKRKHRKPHK